MVVESPFESVVEAAVVDVAPGSVDVVVSGTVVEDGVLIVVEVVVVVVVVAATPLMVRDPTWGLFSWGLQ